MEKVEFTKEMKKDYTILLPNMLPIHFKLITDIIMHSGYKVKLLNNDSQTIITQGLKYVHNDTCYPALLVIGQMIDALNSGEYDLHHTALMITQTGGGCRASNYIHLLRKALQNAGYGYIPVVSLNISGLEKAGGFSLTIPMIQKAVSAIIYGDMLMLLKNQVEPYEVHKGDSEKLVQEFILSLSQRLKRGMFHSKKEMKINLLEIVKRFDEIAINHTEKIKVGIVGEIYIKYAKLGNNNLEGFLKSQDCEIMVPGLASFLIFKVDNRLEDIKLYGGNKIKKIFTQWVLKYALSMEAMIGETIESTKFIATSSYNHLKSLVDNVVGYGNKMGEGWLLTAEMLELISLGYENIVCAQPFGCLPNHIVGRGMMKKVKSICTNANIVAIDYDPSATRVNQENRIKLMLAMANEKLKCNENTTVLQ